MSEIRLPVQLAVTDSLKSSLLAGPNDAQGHVLPERWRYQAVHLTRVGERLVLDHLPGHRVDPLRPVRPSREGQPQRDRVGPLRAFRLLLYGSGPQLEYIGPPRLG